MIKKKIINSVRRLIGTPFMQMQLTEAIQDTRKRLLFEQRCSELRQHIMDDTRDGVSSDTYVSHNIVVSLTSYGRRLGDVSYAIESIMQQIVKPNRIILWLTNDDMNHLPQALMHQQKRGLEIRPCKDLRSYKKLIPALKLCSEDAIITIDDDILYEYDIVDRLIAAYKTNSEYIHACRAHRITFSSDGSLMPYNQWTWCISNVGPNRLNFATSGAGTLFPPHSLDEEVTNEDVFMDICKSADDVWINAMAIKKGTLVNKVQTRWRGGEDYLDNPAVQDTALYNVNAKENGLLLNDKQLKDVFSRYNLYEKLI